MASGARGYAKIDGVAYIVVMAEIRRRVEHIIDADPIIKRGLQRGIVNSRALARYVRTTEGVDSTHDAILGIIRRYKPYDEESADTHHFFRECELTSRNKIAELSVKYRQETMYQVAEFVSNRETTGGEKVKLVVGSGFVKVIADQKALEDFSKTLRPGETIAYSRDLTEITLHLPPATHTTKGIVAKVVMELGLNDINLLGIVDCAPELTLVVAEKDAPRTLEALQTMLSEDAMHSNPNAAIADVALQAQDSPREYPGLDHATSDVSNSPREINLAEAPRNSNSNRRRRP
jgi:hypothetical protein